MARLPRLTLSGQPHHVIQWGHNRQAIVLDDADRTQWLSLLRDSLATYRVALHAWALLDPHFHLLLTPETSDGLSQALQSLGRRYAAYFNRRHGRSGALWEGRFRAGLVEPGESQLQVMQLIEQHAWRSGLSAAPEVSPWSSLDHHLGRVRDALISDGQVWWSLGNTPFEREGAWRRRLEEGQLPAVVQAAAQAARRGKPWGSPSYLQHMAQALGVAVVARPVGRPKRSIGRAADSLTGP